MTVRSLLVAVITGVLVLLAVELAIRAPGQPEVVAAVAAVAVAILVHLGLMLWMVRPLRDQHAALREQLQLAEQGRERLQALEASTSSLRHDLRGILSPALLTADRLLGSEDRLVKRAGEAMVRAVERAEERLRDTREAPPEA